MPSSWLATYLDREMLEVRRGVGVAAANVRVEDLPRKTGRRVGLEIGGRYLLRYLLPYQVGRYTGGSGDVHFTTPTAYAPEETMSYLALPAPTEPRPFVLVLDPRRIRSIWGPQWVRGAPGIEYVLREGFPRDAIVLPGTPGAAWEMVVR